MVGQIHWVYLIYLQMEARLMILTPTKPTTPQIVTSTTTTTTITTITLSTTTITIWRRISEATLKDHHIIRMDTQIVTSLNNLLPISMILVVPCERNFFVNWRGSFVLSMALISCNIFWDICLLWDHRSGQDVDFLGNKFQSNNFTYFPDYLKTVKRTFFFLFEWICKN